MTPNWKPPEYPPPQYQRGQYLPVGTEERRTDNNDKSCSGGYDRERLLQYEELNPAATLATLRRLAPTTELPPLSSPPEGYSSITTTTMKTKEGVTPESGCALYYEVATRTYAWLRAGSDATRAAEESGALVQVDAAKHVTRSRGGGGGGVSPGTRSRSRDGCLTCRQRKKRCCERKPVCSECERLRIRCRWPYPGSERRNRRSGSGGSNGRGRGGSAGSGGSGGSGLPELGPDEMYHAEYGVIKVLRGIVEYRVGE